MQTSVRRDGVVAHGEGLVEQLVQPLHKLHHRNLRGRGVWILHAASNLRNRLVDDPSVGVHQALNGEHFGAYP